MGPLPMSRGTAGLPQTAAVPVIGQQADQPEPTLRLLSVTYSRRKDWGTTGAEAVGAEAHVAPDDDPMVIFALTRSWVEQRLQIRESDLEQLEREAEALENQLAIQRQAAMKMEARLQELRLIFQRLGLPLPPELVDDLELPF